MELRLCERLRVENILLLLVACFVFVPFIWIIAAGFKTQISLLQGEILFTPNLSSFREVMFSKTTEFFSNAFNSLVIATVSTLVIVIAATLGGYAMELMEPLRGMVHTLLVSSDAFLMVPPVTWVAAWAPLALVSLCITLCGLAERGVSIRKTNFHFTRFSKQTGGVR